MGLVLQKMAVFYGFDCLTNPATKEAPAMLNRITGDVWIILLVPGSIVMPLAVKILSPSVIKRH